MSKKSNAAKNIIEPKTESKHRTINDTFIGKLAPMADVVLESYADQLIDWVWENRNNFDGTAESGVRLNDFFNSKRLRKYSFYTWAERNEKLAEAMAFALEVIGSHRERGSMIRKYDSATILRSMAKYDKEDRKLEVWRAKIKAQANAQEEKKKEPIAFNINMVDYSKKVEPKVEEKIKPKSKKKS